MQSVQPSLLARDDTFFGICEGLGEDLGFNPNYLRVALAVGTFFNPLGAVVAYAGAGLVVLATRWLVPNPRRAATSEAAAPAEPKAAPVPQENVNDQDWVALAAAA